MSDKRVRTEDYQADQSKFRLHVKCGARPLTRTIDGKTYIFLKRGAGWEWCEWSASETYKFRQSRTGGAEWYVESYKGDSISRSSAS